MTGLSLAVLAAGPSAAQTLDPTFPVSGVFAPATVYSVIEQADGKRIVTGTFTRINGTAVPRLVRFNTNGALDAQFQQNVGSGASALQRIRQYSNGQIILMGFGGAPVVAGSVSRAGGLLRLNADGTPDASFDAGSGPSQGGSSYYMNDVLPLPNGQVVAVGPFDQFSGITVHNIVRLTTTGSVDASFTQGTGADSEIYTVAGLPDGKMLIGGPFTSYNGFVCNGLARLNANGTFDNTFTSGLTATSEVYNINLQPDGKILVAGAIEKASGSTGLARLNADGTLDNTFTAPASLSAYSIGSFYGEAVQVQPDGKILVSGGFSPYVTRLNPNGTTDATYQIGTVANSLSLSITLLANGSLDLSGDNANFNGVVDRPLVQLTNTGAIDPSFQPVAQLNGAISALVRQTDGKYVVGGTFSEINGQAVRRLARLNANGTLDAAFGFNTGGLNLTVNDVALQSDGSILVATGSQVRRFLSTGSPDNSFSPFLNSGTISRLALQPDGRVLVGGFFNSFSGNTVAVLVRLTSSGSYDNTFAPAISGAGSQTTFQSMALQPDGKLVVAGSFRSTTGNTNALRIVRYTATGAVDATFTAAIPTLASGAGSTTPRANVLTLQADGKVLVGGVFGSINSVVRSNVARLNNNGTLDQSFVPAAFAGTINTLTVQPNQRVLVGGTFTAAGLPANLARVLPDGSADASFAASAVPNSTVRALLVQPDGNIVLGGSFTAVGSAASQALARIMAPNVLHIAAPQAVAERTAAWPVPAHSTLNVAPDATAHAQRLELFDALGRPVLSQLLTGAAPAALPVQTLAPGIYLLRVTYAEGIVTRRVQVQ